jgi:hypothetical protein
MEKEKTTAIEQIKEKIVILYLFRNCLSKSLNPTKTIKEHNKNRFTSDRE